VCCLLTNFRAGTRKTRGRDLGRPTHFPMITAAVPEVGAGVKHPQVVLPVLGQAKWVATRRGGAETTGGGGGLRLSCGRDACSAGRLFGGTPEHPRNSDFPVTIFTKNAHFLLSSKRPNIRSNHDMALSHLIFSYLIFSYLIFSYLIFSYLIFSYLIFSHKVTPSRRGKQIVLEYR